MIRSLIMDLADPSLPWSGLTPRQKNNRIGELIGAEPMGTVFLARNGERLWETRYTLAELDEMQAGIAKWQSTAAEWRKFLKAAPTLDPSWRGEISLVVWKCHIRYAETPGGGWAVVEALRKRGFLITATTSLAGWHIAARRNGDVFGHSAEAGEMHEAACLLALKALT